MSAREPRKLDIETLIVRTALHQPDGARPATPPIVPSVGFVHPTMEAADQALGYLGETPANPDRFVYSRHGAPNQSSFEEALAALEGAQGAVSFSSGMAAMHATLLALVPPGEPVVAAEQLYGVTRALLDWMESSMGLQVRYVDFLDLERLRQTLGDTRPACVVCEVLTNPLVRVLDLAAIAGMAHEVGSPVVVDNTFATPFLLRPLEHGADVVVHSTTKFLNGHGDVLGGVAAGDAETMQRANQYRRVLGTLPGAFDAWLSLRGLRTLALRLRQASANAQQIAAWLVEQDGISQVFYPGLDSDSGHRQARSLLRAGCFGSLIAFEIRGADRAETFAFVERLRLIQPVTSLGDIYSLILHPATSSHRALTPEQLEAQGIYDRTLRLSVGIENAGDLIADLAQAL